MVVIIDVHLSFRGPFDSEKNNHLSLRETRHNFYCLPVLKSNHARIDFLGIVSDRQLFQNCKR